MAHSDFPVRLPLVTDVLARSIHREMLAAEKKAFAYPTWFRHSDAGKCGRYLWFEHENVPASNPPGPSSSFNMWLGTLLHQELQRCLSERFPNCKIEHPVRHGDLSSGHLDGARITFTSGTNATYELKSRNGTQFAKAVGWDRLHWKTKMPEGPTTLDRLQGALNATADNAELLIIGMICLESASKGFAEKNGIDEIGRSVAEWHFEKAEFSPWADMEIARLTALREQMEEGIVPAREAIGDEMEVIKLNPNAGSPPWQCQYCSHLDSCKEDQS